jgi:uncharacterized protein YqjF (DUF2071 family)
LTDDITRTIAHRPWPLPRRPWIMVQSWRSQLFAHWRASPDALRSHVPPELGLDLFEGSGGVGLTTFLVTGLRVRGLPELPFTSEFAQMNLRTYVTFGGRPGVFFFSLDAGNALAVLGARIGFGLPFHRADAAIETQEDGWTRYRSKREAGDAELDVRYRPSAARAFEPKRGTLDYFVTERYGQFAMRSGSVVRSDVHHRPWTLHEANAEFTHNTMLTAAGLDVAEDSIVLHYSHRQDSLIWPPAEAR